MRYPGEWEPHERTIMGWPCRDSLWGPTIEQARADYAYVANAVADFEDVTMIAGSAEDARAARAACTGRVEIVELPIDDSWLRDSGPIYTVDDSGGRVAVHFGFNAWGEKFAPWDRDAEIGGLIARELGDEVRQAPMVLEGGSVISDGDGTILTTEQCLLSRAATRRCRGRGSRSCWPSGSAPSESSGSGSAWSRIATPTATST